MVTLDRNTLEAALSAEAIVTSWVEDEDILDQGGSAMVPQAAAFSLSIPSSLPFRRLYYHIEPTFSVGTPDAPPDYYIRGTLTMEAAGRVVAYLPASIGVDATHTTTSILQASVAKVCASNANNAPSDSIELGLSRRFKSATRTVALAPTRVCCFADRIRYNVHGALATGEDVIACRFWLGVLSSNRPL